MGCLPPSISWTKRSPLSLPFSIELILLNLIEGLSNLRPDRREILESSLESVEPTIELDFVLNLNNKVGH
jgi:hypothetical protein